MIRMRKPSASASARKLIVSTRAIEAVATVSILLGAVASADPVPSLINYQGRLSDALGAPVAGVKSMKFAFYTAVAGGELLPAGLGTGRFMETQSVAVCDGIFNALIGSATVGGIRWNDGISTITANLIAGNQAGRSGGGAFCDSIDPVLFSANTVVGNRSAAYGGARLDWENPGSAVLSDGIFWGNKSDSGQPIRLHADNGSAVRVSHCDIEGGKDAISLYHVALDWGPDNIDADPLFVQPGQWDETGVFIPGDYHLLPGSPCIDAGTNDIDNPDTPAVETLPDTDIAGNPRIIDGNLDGVAPVEMGAYEYLPGDANYDGKVNVIDLIFIRNSLGKDPASLPAARRADLNNDGRVDMLDLIFARDRMWR